jgi:Rrf2 family transcriptional regulator, cysteine metabolism repressor
LAVKFSTTFRYGARAVVELAAAYPDRAVSVREIGEQQGISAKFLEHILGILKAAGLVQAVRGMNGGYVLARPPENITLRDLHESLIGSTAPVDCVDCPDACAMPDVCPTRDTWIEIQEAVDAVLERTTVQDLVQRRRCKAISSALDYCI